MGGMGLGSFLLPRLISAQWHPLRVYAWLELGIGAIGLIVLFGMPAVVRFYTSNAAPGLAGILLRGAVSAVCLLPPTMLMGATLPALSRWIETTPRGVSWLGFLYGGNTAGAVFGCLLSGFYLLRIYDVSTATRVAALINGAVALLGFVLAIRTPHSPPTDEPGRVRADRGRESRPVLVVIALSGFCALGAEVVWTRLLSLMLGGTVYTFSIILAVFLAGLGIGSGIGSLLTRGTGRPRTALGYCQILLTAAIAWAAFMLAKSLPYWRISPAISNDPWSDFLMDLVRCLCAILPPACLWGASFPLALGAVASHEGDPGRIVGKVYAANTAGAILGSIGFSLIMIPALGTQWSQRLLIGLSAIASLLAFAPPLRQVRTHAGSDGELHPPPPRTTAAASWTAALGLAVVLAWSVPGVPWELIAFGRKLPVIPYQGVALYVGEGMNSSVAVTQLDSGVRNFHVNGKVEASSHPQDMRLERMLGHIPALFHPKPRSVLVVGCGAGITAGSFVLHPDMERIVICEIEPLIPRVVARFFGRENYGVLDDPRVEVVIDDARHFILTTQEKFDIITSDPIHPWIKGSATLYSKEYFELCRRRLNRGGLITQWVPLYESTLDAVKSEIATFFEVFPQGTIWGNDATGLGYDVVLLGQDGTMSISVDGLQERLDRDDHQSVAQSIKEVGFPSAVDLLSTYAGQGPDLEPWLKGAEINRDQNLRLQYLAGMGLNSSLNIGIYDDLLKFLRFPGKLFVGSEKRMQALRQALKLSQ
jgi:spermidine synthase